MPIYEYTCSSCGKTSDVLQKISDPPPELCDFCSAQGTLQRVVSRTSFVLKGGGWYSDLYGSNKKKEGGGSEGGGGAKGSGGDTSSSSGSSTPNTPSTPSTPAPSSGDSPGPKKEGASTPPASQTP